MIYIHLFHGRDNPDDNMEEKHKDNGGWGYDGPMFACESIHGTYHSHFRLWNVRISGGEIARDESWLHWYEDMIFYDGKFYGDFSIADHPVDEQLVVPYDEQKAAIPPELRKKLEKKYDERNQILREAGFAG